MKKTNKILDIVWSDGRQEGFYIFVNKFTPFRYCCEYKNYYEVALYSSYLRVDKKTMVVTTDGKTSDKFEIAENVKASIRLDKKDGKMERVVKFESCDIGLDNISLTIKEEDFIVRVDFGLIEICKVLSDIGRKVLYRKVISIDGLSEADIIKKISPIIEKELQKNGIVVKIEE